MGPIDFAVAAFEDQAKAGEVLKELQESQKAGAIRLLNAAVIVKDDNGKVRIRETEDVDAGRGALFGALAGGLIGLLGGPAGMLVGAAAGAAAGGAGAGLMDFGFKDEHLREFEEVLGRGDSALIALVEHEWVERLAEEVERFEGRLLRQAIKSELAAQLVEQSREGMEKEMGRPGLVKIEVKKEEG